MRDEGFQASGKEKKVKNYIEIDTSNMELPSLMGNLFGPFSKKMD